MDLLRLVSVFESERHELVGADDAIDEVGAALDHALVDELLERLLLAHAPQVVEEHVPETRIHQVARGVLDAADVEVDRTPIVVGLLAYQRLGIVRIHITQVVGRRTGEAGHGRQLVGVAFGRVPALRASQRRLAFGRGAEVLDGRQLQRQLVGGEGVGHVVLVVDGERLAPIALAREDGVAQAVVDQAFAQTAALDLVEHQRDSLLDILAVEEIGVDHAPLLGVVGFLFEVAALDYGDDLQPEAAGEGVVARVVGRNGHDGARAVAGEHVVGDVDRDGPAGKGIDGERTCGHAADASGLGDALALGALLGLMYSSTAARFPGAVSSPTHSCSGAMTMNVTPKMVSGRVVKISSLRSEPSMSKKTCAPTERPIQLRWISLSESLQASLSSPSSMRWA